ncbi:MAG: lamin tail domain-containing protein [Pseudomonadota bacterium]
MPLLSLPFALLLTASCGPQVPDPSPGAAAIVVSFQPSAELSSVPSVVQMHLVSKTLSAGSATLFQGSLSDYYLSKVKQGEVPDALAARQIPLLSWRTPSELVASPLVALAAGPYSLVAPSGVLSEFQVATELPLLRRVWPPSGLGGSVRYAVYCAAESAVAEVGSLVLAPGALSVDLAAGADPVGSFAAECVHFNRDAELDPGQMVVPEPKVGAWALDPSAFTAATAEPATAATCAAGEAALGLGCVTPADDRLLVRPPSAAVLWVIHTPAGALLQVTRAGIAFAVRGLSPSSHERVWGSVHDEAGNSLDFDSFFDTGRARARPVLSEVLANPLGPEPQGEWIELVNDGSLALQLSSYALQDGGGKTALPDATLAPGEYALLVRNDFAPAASDEPPAAATRLIRMPALGKSGLSNNGERLALLDGTGKECSVMPALPTKPGQSMARSHPWSLDSDPDAFTLGAPTPGLPNDAVGAR